MARKKSAAINDLINSGLVGDGELLRYKNKQGQLLLIGRARIGGIEVQGSAGLLNFTAFEAAAGSKYHRPAEHTHAVSGRTLQALQIAGSSGDAAPADRAARGGAEGGEPLFEEEHDEFCYVCGLGGDLMCCETCSATTHAHCAGLAAVPEGDWHCPWCHCGGCGQAGWDPAGPLLPAGVAWVECGEQYRGMADMSSELYCTPLVGGPETQGSSAEPAAPQAPVAVPAAGPDRAEARAGVPAPHQPTGAEVAQRMEIDGGAEPSRSAQQPTPSVAAEAAPPAAPGQGSGAEGTQAPQAQGPASGASDPAAAAAGSSGGRLDLTRLLSVLVEASTSAPPPATSAAPAAPSELDPARQGFLGQQLPACSPPAASGEVRCPATGRRYHSRCLPPAAAAAAAQGVPALWFGSRAGELLSWQLAQLCSRGLIPVGVLGDGTLLSFQLIRGAAVAHPQDCCGYAPRYSESEREHLRQALSAAAYILQSCYEPLPDSRTGGDAMLWMLRGACLAGRQLDYSTMHTALLYVGSTLAATACVRLHGPGIAEVPLLATRPELQRNGLGGALLCTLEALVAGIFCSAASAGAGAEEGGAGGPMLLTPAFWGPYLGYPPGQPGVQDVVPITTARWGYALATPEQLLRAWRHPLVRLPGLLLSCKCLDGRALAPRLALPRRLVLNEAGADVARMLREGTAVVAPKAQAPQEPAAQPDVKPEAGGDLPGSGLKQEQGGA